MASDKNILIDIWLLGSLTDRLVAEVLEGSRLSVDEFAMYGLISDLAPITSADLVRASGRSPTTISSMVRRSEARGDLVRTEDPDDARSALLELTPQGRNVLGGVVPGLLKLIDEIRAGLGGTHDAIRKDLRGLDKVLRDLLGVGPRPYRLITEPHATASLSYSGEPLNAAQAKEARQFIDWLRVRPPLGSQST